MADSHSGSLASEASVLTTTPPLVVPVVWPSPVPRVSPAWRAVLPTSESLLAHPLLPAQNTFPSASTGTISAGLTSSLQPTNSATHPHCSEMAWDPPKGLGTGLHPADILLEVPG